MDLGLGAAGAESLTLTQRQTWAAARPPSELKLRPSDPHNSTGKKGKCSCPSNMIWANLKQTHALLFNLYSIRWLNMEPVRLASSECYCFSARKLLYEGRETSEAL